jgi:GntR family transcriptional regulator
MLDNQHKKFFRRITYPSVTDEVINQILNAIRTDVFTPGVRLPSEPNLADQMGVSRNTLREALNTLIEKGFLFRQRGVGTFVTPQSVVMLKANLSNVVSTSGLITNQKKEPGQANFTYRFELPSKKVAENLHVPETQKVMHVSRVRTADGVPVILSEEYFSSNISGLDYDLSMYTTLDNWSIYDYFKKANYNIQSVITHVHAISADLEMAQELDVEEHSALLCLEQIHFSNAYIRPLLFCMNYHNDKIINIMLVRSI